MFHKLLFAIWCFIGVGRWKQTNPKWFCFGWIVSFDTCPCASLTHLVPMNNSKCQSLDNSIIVVPEMVAVYIRVKSAQKHYSIDHSMVYIWSVWYTFHLNPFSTNPLLLFHYFHWFSLSTIIRCEQRCITMSSAVLFVFPHEQCF